jgi:hypothetical protein
MHAIVTLTFLAVCVMSGEILIRKRRLARRSSAPRQAVPAGY